MPQIDVELANNLKELANIAWKVEYDNVVTLSAETCVEDLIYCIRTNPKKLQKRIKRLKFCIGCFENIPEKLKIRARNTINEYSSKIVMNDDIDEEYFLHLHNIEEYLCSKSETKKPFFIESDSDPANILFNEELKKKMNADGKVYKSFTQVAVIALFLMKRYIKQSDKDIYTKNTVQNMKIVFKGGAAMGHFLFQDPKVWHRLSEKDKEYVMTSFIKGGDNDTSLVFTKDVDDNIRGMLLNEYMKFVRNVMTIFHIEKMINSYILETEKSIIKCFADEYFIHKSKRKSYAIVDYVDGIKTIKYNNDISKSILYFTHSKCSFDTRDGRSDFYLSRVKAAFKAYSLESITKWNKKISCNAECLDVSVATSKDVRPFVASYTTLSHLY